MNARSQHYAWWSRADERECARGGGRMSDLPLDRPKQTWPALLHVALVLQLSFFIVVRSLQSFESVVGNKGFRRSYPPPPFPLSTRLSGPHELPTTS